MYLRHLISIVFFLTSLAGSSGAWAETETLHETLYLPHRRGLMPLTVIQ